MAKRETKTLKIDEKISVALTPTSRFTPIVEGYLAEYERILLERKVALEHDAYRDAFVLQLQLEAIEDQIRSSFQRDKFWSV